MLIMAKTSHEKVHTARKPKLTRPQGWSTCPEHVEDTAFGNVEPVSPHGRGRVRRIRGLRHPLCPGPWPGLCRNRHPPFLVHDCISCFT